MLKKLYRNAKRAFTLASHAGSRFCCPFCGYKSNAWSRIGIDIPVLKEKQVVGAGLRNAGCYKCGSHDRERLVFTYLKEELRVLESPDLKILHLAPERNLSKVLRSVGFQEYICGDLFTEGYRYPDYVQNMNVLNIPFGDNYFDLVICNHLLEHVPNDMDAMKELFRVLKPNGKAILQVPISKNSESTLEDFSIIDPDERKRVFGQFDHVRIYGQDYLKRLGSVGFTVQRINISSNYERNGLCVDEDIFVGIK